MSLVFVEGFDQYKTGTGQASAEMLASGRYVGWLPNLSVVSPGRSGRGNYLSASTASCLLPDAYTSIIVGTAVSHHASGSYNVVTLRYSDGGSQYIHLYVGFNELGQIWVTCGGTTYYSPIGTIIGGAWNYLEISADIDATAGSFEIRLNGGSVLSRSGINTRNSLAPSSVNMVVLELNSTTTMGIGGGYDDVYVLELDSGTGLRTFLGDITVETLFPNADGDANEMTPSTAGDHYAMVDEVNGLDGSTTYVYTGVGSFQELYQIGDLAADITQVLAVEVAVVARKTVIGTMIANLSAKLSGVQVNSDDWYLPTAYTSRFMMLESNPSGGSWTVNDVNNLQIGFKSQ